MKILQFDTKRSIFSILLFLCFLLPVLPYGADHSIVRSKGISNSTTTRSLFPPREGIAFSTVNISLDSDSLGYSRHTFVDNPQVQDPIILTYEAIADLTTHNDIYVQFMFEIEADNWNDNFTEFKNSDDFDRFTENSELLDKMIPVNVSLLNVQTTSLSIMNDTIRKPGTIEDIKIFRIFKKIVIHESTAFLLSLDEPFAFDLNKIQLGQIRDFHFSVSYRSGWENPDDGEPHVEESLRILAPGSPLEDVASTKGLNGNVRFSFFEPRRVDMYRRQFAEVKHIIDLSIIVPKEQTVSYKLDFGDFTSEVDFDEDNQVRTTKNSVTIMVETDGYMPVYININSAVPIWEQFSIVDYASYSVAILVAMIGFLRGLPAILTYLSINRFKEQFYITAREGKEDEIEAVLGKAKELFTNRKIPLGLYDELLRTLELFREFDIRQTTQVEIPKVEVTEKVDTEGSF